SFRWSWNCLSCVTTYMVTLGLSIGIFIFISFTKAAVILYRYEQRGTYELQEKYIVYKIIFCN
ncbi:MAG TPA: hypothetical protein PLS43_05630, partial [Syntrophales bacterium]|nr:hypothetical protein [Syntrophales bacterium]